MYAAVKQNVKYFSYYFVLQLFFAEGIMLNMGKEIREPRQERSIEKKNKIIRAGYELFSEVGYYNTNTAEIARRAGVSTGIVYGYFDGGALSLYG